MDQRPPESEARLVIVGMLVLTFVVVTFAVATADVLSTSVRSLLVIGWIAVMGAVLRRYRL